MASHLKNISWTVGVTAASSDSETVGSAFVRLKLDLEETKDKLVTLDLSPKEFFSLLHELESAKFCLQSVNSAET